MKAVNSRQFGGSLLRERRKRVGLSLRGLAVLAGMSWQALSLIELGRRQPRPITLARIEAALDIAAKSQDES